MGPVQELGHLSFLSCWADALTFPSDLQLAGYPTGPEGFAADRENIKHDFEKAADRVLLSYKGDPHTHDRLRALQRDETRRLLGFIAHCVRLTDER